MVATANTEEIEKLKLLAKQKKSKSFTLLIN